MRLPKFNYVEPRSIKEASSILSNDPNAKILAGGTDLLVNMKHRVEVPSVLVNIKRISELNFIEQENGAVRIGALLWIHTIIRAWVPLAVIYVSKIDVSTSINPNGGEV